MSECVVRLKIPSSCNVCPLRIACVLYRRWLANEADMPCVYDDGCLIVCQLPERHGRLADADACASVLKKLENEAVNSTGKLCYGYAAKMFEEAFTIVPAEAAERSEHEHTD